MAAFRLVYVCSTAASSSSWTHLFLPPRPPPNPCLHSLTTKATKLRRPNIHLFLVRGQVRVHPIVQSEENVAEEDEISKTKLLVQNVPWNCTVDDLIPLFQKFGTVVAIEFSMYNKVSNRGLAFVSMASHEEALAALNNLESTEFGDRILKLNWAKPKKTKHLTPRPPPQPEPFPVHNLFVGNLPFQAGSKDLKDFFNAENANAFSAEIVYLDNPRLPAGYGFVSFNTEEESESALVALQGKEFMGRPIRVERSKRFLRQGTKATIESESAEVFATE